MKTNCTGGTSLKKEPLVYRMMFYINTIVLTHVLVKKTTTKNTKTKTKWISSSQSLSQVANETKQKKNYKKNKQAQPHPPTVYSRLGNIKYKIKLLTIFPLPDVIRLKTTHKNSVFLNHSMINFKYQHSQSILVLPS